MWKALGLRVGYEVAHILDLEWSIGVWIQEDTRVGCYPRAWTPFIRWFGSGTTSFKLYRSHVDSDHV